MSERQTNRPRNGNTDYTDDHLSAMLPNNKYAVASRPTAGRLVRGLSDRLSVGNWSDSPRTSRSTVRRTSRRTAGAGIAASCRQNISTYAPINATTREYIPARKIPYMEEIYL